MLKKLFISLFLIVYLSVSAVSFADEVVLEIVSETPASVIEIVPEPVVENIPEEIISETPAVEEIILPASGDVPEPSVADTPVSQEALPSQEVPVENVPEPAPEESVLDMLLPPSIDTPDIFNAAPGETIEQVVEDIPTTEEPPTTLSVEVEENSIFTPPGPEPEPWQPAVVEDPTTESNTIVGDTETHSDPVFLAENSVFTRRMIENIVIDPAAKHSCKVDVFRTDISETAASTLLVKFYGTSMLAAYDAEIGSLPNGIDVRFAKNNDYIYDFRGKETTLELSVNNQDGSLTGDFTIPIIYTYKGKKESTVICQLNIVNEEEEVSLIPVIVPIVQPVEPVLEPAQELVEEILDAITPEPVIEPVIDPQTPTTVEEILEILVPEDIPPVTLPIIEIPPITVPEIEDLPPMIPPTETTPPEPVADPVPPSVIEPEEVPEPVVVEFVPEIVAPVVENPPAVESTPISPPDVSSI